MNEKKIPVLNNPHLAETVTMPIISIPRRSDPEKRQDEAPYSVIDDKNGDKEIIPTNPADEETLREIQGLSFGYFGDVTGKIKIKHGADIAPVILAMSNLGTIRREVGELWKKYKNQPHDASNLEQIGWKAVTIGEKIGLQQDEKYFGRLENILKDDPNL